MKFTLLKTISFNLLLFGLLFFSCEKNEISNNVLPTEGSEVEIGGEKQTLEGSWSVTYMDEANSNSILFHFSFYKNNECRFSTHNTNYAGTYSFFTVDKKYYIKINVPELSEKADGFIALVAKTFDGDSFEYVTVYMDKTPHHNERFYRMDRERNLHFESSFFDTEWEVLSEDMAVDRGAYKSMTFNKEGVFTGKLISGYEVKGSFNESHTDHLIVETKYGLSNFELKFLAFENKEKTKIKVEFKNPMKQFPVVGYLQKK